MYGTQYRTYACHPLSNFREGSKPYARRTQGVRTVVTVRTVNETVRTVATAIFSNFSWLYIQLRARILKGSSSFFCYRIDIGQIQREKVVRFIFSCNFLILSCIFFPSNHSISLHFNAITSSFVDFIHGNEQVDINLGAIVKVCQGYSRSSMEVYEHQFQML